MLFAWSIPAVFCAISATAADIIYATAADIWSRVALSNGVFIGVLRGVLVEACVQLGVEATSQTDGCRNHGLPGPIVLPSAHSHHGNARPGRRLVDVLG